MKLKALTLVGFKSFADKTTFEFHEGVTCVVGPNGCGKSNVIDAFKWVLGERSARSLRGDAMQDVIFNGTAERRSAGLAEVSLTFEDPTGLLRLPGEDRPAGGDGQEDEPERTITITRRLYRSGESEYLINNQPARLRDIREMFMDTGVGCDAYSLIEQGKVEAFLQASAQDRRAVFDEAAGISKYKARKREAIRRLERVEQNLLRLMDILGEVQKRLRSIKYQAGKARRYQAFTTRLRELRSLFSLAEYHRLTVCRRELQATAAAATDALANLAARIDQLEASRSAVDAELADLEARSRAIDARTAEVSAQLVACRQGLEVLTARAAELGDVITAESARREQLEARVESCQQKVDARRRELEALETELAELSRREAACRLQVAEASAGIQQLRGQLEDEKNGTIDLLRRTAQLHNEINTYGIRRENLRAQRQRLAGRAEEIARTLEELLVRRSAVSGKLEEVRAVLADSQRRLEEAHARAEELQEADRRLEPEVSRARQEHSAMLSRQAVLEEMQQRFEGLGEGVRRVLAAVTDGRAPSVRGILGNFLETDMQHAAVIEAALAGAEEWLVVDKLAEAVEAAPALRELLAGDGGVELICLDELSAAASAPDGPVPEGAVARASEWVRCEPFLAPAVELLLGRTVVVDSLERAYEIARRQPRRWRFVTLAGEVLERDGRLRLGSPRSSAGVVSRRSELAELARRLEESELSIAALEARREELRAKRTHQDEVIKALRTAVYEANTERVEYQSLLERLEEQIAQLEKEAPLVAEEVRQLADEIDSAVRMEHEAKERVAKLEELRRQREAEIARLNDALAEASQRYEALVAEMTAGQVKLAEVRQKRDALKAGLSEVTSSGESARRELGELSERIEQARRRRAQAEQEAAETRERIAALMRERAALMREAEETAGSRRSLAKRQEEVRQQLAQQRSRHDEQNERLGELRVRIGEVEVRIENLISRTSDELGLDLPALYRDYVHDEQRDWEAVKAEIAELRGKIERLGNVNLDAIGEQEQLQQREAFLTAQVEDVRASQRQLADLIKRINAESRRRFEESFQAVRVHFNELFRKLFGGGKADILLSNPDDVLDSGIEIVARPPGKELRSISLLSGGEKTLTTLALMFSFFKAGPSPFCLLDEVDAALDEPNTERFVRLVREFLDTGQFIIISHAKRTIAMADQIYGVTMQEPGVSTRIAVRFEDATAMTEDSRRPRAVPV